MQNPNHDGGIKHRIAGNRRQVTRYAGNPRRQPGIGNVFLRRFQHRCGRIDSHKGPVGFQSCKGNDLASRAACPNHQNAGLTDIGKRGRHHAG
ncbi:hypothetical protein D3C80_1800360 [compost metagenome]